jgi:hypothetical protein
MAFIWWSEWANIDPCYYNRQLTYCTLHTVFTYCTLRTAPCILHLALHIAPYLLRPTYCTLHASLCILHVVLHAAPCIMITAPDSISSCWTFSSRLCNGYAVYTILLRVDWSSLILHPTCPCVALLYSEYDKIFPRFCQGKPRRPQCIGRWSS